MDWLTQILIFGFAALLFFIGSIVCACQNKYYLGLLCGILELVSAVISSGAWAWALKVSGKADWFLLGLRGYTLLSFIFWDMLAVGAVCLVINGRGLARNRKSAQF